MRKRPDRLVQRHLKRPGIDARQQIAGSHELSLVKRHVYQRSIDTAAHRHGVQRGNSPEGIDISIDAARGCGHGSDRNGPARIALALARRGRRRVVAHENENSDASRHHHRPNY
jgi:hypothetical protein